MLGTDFLSPELYCWFVVLVHAHTLAGITHQPSPRLKTLQNPTGSTHFGTLDRSKGFPAGPLTDQGASPKVQGNLEHSISIYQLPEPFLADVHRQVPTSSQHTLLICHITLFYLFLFLKKTT